MVVIVPSSSGPRLLEIWKLPRHFVFEVRPLREALKARRLGGYQRDKRHVKGKEASKG